MTAFDEMFAAAGLEAQLTMFGEKIVYRPLNGMPRTITAIVQRNPPQELPGMDQGRAPRFVIEAANDPFYPVFGGISSAEIETGGGKVDVAERKGEKPKTKAITKLLSDVAGMSQFEAR